jgi:glycosyltransferase involved in cell wall biosynthesis
MPAISLVMPCYNRAHGLPALLQAYEQQETEAPFEIIAVDDASTDSTYQFLTSYQPKNFTLRVERMEKNSGQGMARNRVIPQVQSPLTMFVGDDMFPAPGLVQGHLAAHRTMPEAGIAILGRVEWPADLPCNTLMAHIDGIGAQQFSYHYLQNGHEYDFRHFYTCNISLKTAFIQALDHWFDPDFYLYGFEDVELGYRLVQRGMRILYQRPMLMRHYHYYNIWTFAGRQRKSGIMANILTRKHTRLTYKFRAQYLRVLNLLRQTRVLLRPFPPAKLDWIEQVSLYLASFYEWKPNVLLDRLYLGMLDYFYYDGFIRGYFGDSSLTHRVRAAHASRYLLPNLLSYLHGAAELGIELPPSYGRPLVQTLSDPNLR